MVGGNSCNNWSMGEPPKLTKDNFIIWKNRMILFLNCVDSDLLTTIKEGPYVPQVLIPAIPAFGNTPAIPAFGNTPAIPAFGNTPASPARYQDKERRNWSEDDIEKVALEHKAKHIIVMSIPDDIYRFVINCKTAKEIWDSLVVFFEGTDEVKEHKGLLLVRQYEMFTSKPGESVTDMYCRFTCLLNDLKEHNKVFDNEEVLLKLLESLAPEWENVSIIIRQVKNLKTMSLQTLYGILMAQELSKEMKKLTRNKVVVKDEVKLKATNDEGWKGIGSNVQVNVK